MKHRFWTVRRQAVNCPDAQLRWDQAYQSLVIWSCRQNAKPSDSEEHYENRSVCTGQKSPTRLRLNPSKSNSIGYGYRSDLDQPRNPQKWRLEETEAAHVAFLFDSYL